LRSLHLRLPATSANLGPGFDAMALALSHFLDIEAHPANGFSIEATGWNADICSRLTQNLLIETYEAVLATEGKTDPPLGDPDAERNTDRERMWILCCGPPRRCRPGICFR
jgi:homoserine kinase